MFKTISFVAAMPFPRTDLELTASLGWNLEQISFIESFEDLQYFDWILIVSWINLNSMIAAFEVACIDLFTDLDTPR